VRVGTITGVLMLLGVSHHDLELADLQRLSAGAENIAEALIAAGPVAGAERPSQGQAPHGSRLEPADGPIRGAIALATCNRVEIYLDARRFHDAVDTVAAVLAAAAGMSTETVAAQLKVRVGAPVAAHLFAVAAGLDSMVVGEAEISGQVSRSLRRAQQQATVSPLLNQLFQRASRTAKLVQSRTRLGAAGRSVASVALDVVEADQGALAGRTALIVGTGAYARVVASALRARGCTDLRVYSPSGRAEAFASTHGAHPVATAELPTALKEVDLLVACSGTTGGALTAELMDHSGRDRPLTVVDLALRSDIPDDVRALPSVRVVDLHTVAANAPQQQLEPLTEAQDLVISAVAEFEESQAVRALDPAVVALRSHVSGVVAKEMDRLRVKFTDDVAAELEQALHRVTRSMLHTPTLRAQELARSGNAAGYVAALHTLFGIELAPAAE
jgi:glutamyl-tRNA reductase